jgi:hypothetical protein
VELGRLLLLLSFLCPTEQLFGIVPAVLVEMDVAQHAGNAGAGNSRQAVGVPDERSIVQPCPETRAD